MKCLICTVTLWVILSGEIVLVRAEEPLQIGETFSLSVDSSQAVNDLPSQQTATGLRWVLQKGDSHHFMLASLRMNDSCQLHCLLMHHARLRD